MKAKMTIILITIAMIVSVLANVTPLVTTAAMTQQTNSDEDLSVYMRSVFKSTSRPDLDPYVFAAFEKIEQSRYLSDAMIVFEGSFEECWDFRDYFNYAFGFTYHFRLDAYRTSASSDYVVAFRNLDDLDNTISDYIKVSRNAQVLAESLRATSDTETVSNILKWIGDNMRYDFTLHSTTASNEDMLKSYYGFYDGNPTLCKGYSIAFYQLCSMNGIKATLATGTYRGNGHAWNTVYLNDTWLFIDALNESTMISDVLPAGYIMQ